MIGLVSALALAACTAAGPPKPPPPPIQEGADSTPRPLPTAGLPDVPTAPAAPEARSAPLPPPTMPPAVVAAIADAPDPPAEVEPDALPSGRELANGLIAVLDRVKTARLKAVRWKEGSDAPKEHSDVLYVAPDRLTLTIKDDNDQEVSQAVFIGDTAYGKQAAPGAAWQKQVREAYRSQAQIFRPVQIALATGEPQPLDSGSEVELIDDNGKQALHAIFAYGSSPELEQLDRSRSSAEKSILDVVVDPTTWEPLRHREEIRAGADRFITEVEYVSFDEPITIDPPIP